MSMTRSITRSLLSLAVTSVLLGLLAGCGGGAGGGGGAAGGPSGTAAPASSASSSSAAASSSSSAAGGTITPTAIELLTSSPTIASSGAGTVDITAIVLNAAGVIANKPVELLVLDAGPNSDPTRPAFLTSVSAGGITDTNGRVTAKLNVGTNNANRTITIRARSLNAAGAQDCCSPDVTTTVNVIGTTVGVTGSTSLVLGSTTPVTVTLLNSAGAPIANAPAILTSQVSDSIAAPITPSVPATGGLITLTSAANFPSGSAAAPSTIQIDQEQITYTTTVGSSLTVLARGANGTAPATHSVGATVVLVSTTVPGASVAGSAISFPSSVTCAAVPTSIPAASIPSTAARCAIPGGGLGLPFTNNAGQLTVTVTGSVAGGSTVTACSPTCPSSAGGASASINLSVSSASFSFTTPPAGTEVPVSTAQALTVTFLNAVGVPQAGVTITFSATRGTYSAAGGGPPCPAPLPAATAVTTGAGVATIFICSSSAGPTVIRAVGPGGTPAATLNVLFVANTVSRLEVQAQPSAVPANLPGASTNTSTIIATVRDSANNLVKNALVTFSLTDPSGGNLDQPSATTNASGVASVTYSAGSTSSPFNGVVVMATASLTNSAGVTTTAGPSSATLTVGGQSLFIRLGTDNTLSSTGGGLAYLKRYTAIVTDAAGNPATTAAVTFTLRPVANSATIGVTPAPPLISGAINPSAGAADASFTAGGTWAKGFWQLPCKLQPGGGNCVPTAPWEQHVTSEPATAGSEPAAADPTTGSIIAGQKGFCQNEDRNFNGLKDTGDILVGPTGAACAASSPACASLPLRPGDVANVNTNASVDSSGLAIASITYPKNFAAWVRVRLTATAVVGGDQGSNFTEFVLPIAGPDTSSATVPPPGQVSPFGQNTSCSDSN